MAEQIPTSIQEEISAEYFDVFLSYNWDVSDQKYRKLLSDCFGKNGKFPFKTAITLRFMAPINIVMWAVFLLIINLFIERAYCRYICPLGAGLAVLGKVRIMNFLKRRKECGNPS